MRTLAAAVVIMSALGATAASAQPGRLSDAAYLQAARCAGLASSSNLQVTDGKAVTVWFKSQSQGRIPYLVEKADEMERSAKRQADRASDPEVKAKLNGELQSMCAQLRS